MKKTNLTARYILIQIFLWAEFGCMYSYGNQYLTERLHLTDTAAGLILGVATGVAFLLQPPLTAYAERTNTRRVLALAAAASALCALATLLPLGTVATVLCFALSCTALLVMPSFSNALGMAGIRSGRSINFGLARGLGSVSFAVAARLVAPLIHSLGRQAIPLSGAAMVLGALVMVLLFPQAAPAAAAAAPEEAPDSARVFFRSNRRFFVLLAGITLLYAGHNSLSNFMFRVAQNKIPNGDIDAATTLQGTALMISALMELPTMFLFTRMVKKLRCDLWLVLSGVFMLLRLVLSIVLPGEVGLCVAQTVQLLGFALLAVSSVYYVGTVIDRRNVIKGQTYLGATSTLGSVLAYVMCGALVDAIGVVGMLTVFSALTAVGGLLTLLARQRVARPVGVD